MPSYPAADDPGEVATEPTHRQDAPKNGASGSYCEFLATTFLVDMSAKNDEESLIYDPMVNQVKLIGEILATSVPNDLLRTYSSSTDESAEVTFREAGKDTNGPSR